MGEPEKSTDALQLAIPKNSIDELKKSDWTASQGEIFRRRTRWAIFFILCLSWLYIEWTVYSSQRVELRRDSTFNIAKGGVYWGWVYYNKNNEEITFHIWNSSRQAVNFKGARYFLVLKGWNRYLLEFRQLKNIHYGKETQDYILWPYPGDYNLVVRCDLPLGVTLFEDKKTHPEKIKGFDIVLADGRKILFGYEELNYLQKIKKFLLIKKGLY